MLISAYATELAIGFVFGIAVAMAGFYQAEGCGRRYNRWPYGISPKWWAFWCWLFFPIGTLLLFAGVSSARAAHKRRQLPSDPGLSGAQFRPGSSPAYGSGNDSFVSPPR